MDLQSVLIVIPSANPKNLDRCIRSLERFHQLDKGAGNLIIVSDGLPEGEREKYPEAGWIEAPKPFCFARNINLALKEYRGLDFFLMNDDAELVTEMGIAYLLVQANALRQEGKRVGILSATIQGSCGTIQKFNPHLSQEYVEAPCTSPHDTLWFVACLLDRELIREIGLLDEDFNGYGFEDTDYCFRAKRAGFTVGVGRSCLVLHVDGSTYRSDLRQWRPLYESNQEKFFKKWAGPRY